MMVWGRQWGVTTQMPAVSVAAANDSFFIARPRISGEEVTVCGVAIGLSCTRALLRWLIR
jgi:hypothetical protein